MSFTTRTLRYMSNDQEDTTLYSSPHDDLHVFELSTVRIVVPIQKHCERKRERPIHQDQKRPDSPCAIFIMVPVDSFRSSMGIGYCKVHQQETLPTFLLMY